MNSLINFFFHSFFLVGSPNSFDKIFTINFVKQGDKSNVNNLNNEITFAGS